MCFRSRHPWQMRGAARARDDHFDAPAFRLRCVLSRFRRRAVRRQNPAFMRYLESLQRLRRVASHTAAVHVGTRPTNGISSARKVGRNAQ